MRWIVDRVRWALGKLNPFSRSGTDSEAAGSAEAPSSRPADTSAPEPADEPSTEVHEMPSSETDPEAEASSEEEPRNEAEDETKAEDESHDESHGEDENDGEPEDDSGKSDENDASDITAPSIGPNTVIEHEPPEERLDHDKISDTDAMGNDKRREVVGQRYSASPARQATLYAIFVAIVIGVVIGGKALADKLDEPSKTVKDAAPWTGAENQTQPDLDFPKYGKPAS